KRRRPQESRATMTAYEDDEGDKGGNRRGNSRGDATLARKGGHRPRSLPFRESRVRQGADPLRRQPRGGPRRPARRPDGRAPSAGGGGPAGDRHDVGDPPARAKGFS